MRRPLLIRSAVALIVILLVVAVGIVVMRQGGSSTNQKSVSQNLISPAVSNVYHYQAMDSFMLGTKGDMVTFDKPSEFKPLGQVPAKTVQALLVHLPSTRILPDYGRIAIAVTSYGPKSQFDDQLTQLNDPKSSGYQRMTEVFKGFINPRLPITYSVSELGVFKPLTNSNINSNSWEAGFTADSTNQRLPKLQGEFLVAVGDQSQSVYYFMVENVARTWQANQPVWQKVIDSLRIDQ